MDDIGLLEKLITTVLSFFSGCISLFPEIDISAGDNIVNGINTFVDILSKCSFALPVVDILVIASFVAVIRVATFGIFIVNWIIRRIADIIP